MFLPNTFIIDFTENTYIFRPLHFTIGFKKRTAVILNKTNFLRQLHFIYENITDAARPLVVSDRDKAFCTSDRMTGIPCVVNLI